MSSTKFVFFGPIGKTRWPPWPLIGWDISDFSSETAERNSTKLDRKQDLNVLYQVCVFRKNKMAALASDWLRHFRLLLWNRLAERNSTKLDRKQDPNVLYQVCVFRADRKNKMAALASDWLRQFRLLLWNRRTEFKVHDMWSFGPLVLRLFLQHLHQVRKIKCKNNQNQGTPLYRCQNG